MDNARFLCSWRTDPSFRSAGKAEDVRWESNERDECLLHSGTRCGSGRWVSSFRLSPGSREYAGRLDHKWGGRRRNISGRRPGEITGVHARSKNSASALILYYSNRAAACRAFRPHRLHDSREPAARQAHDPHFTGPSRLRSLPARAFRTWKQPLSISLH